MTLYQNCLNGFTPLNKMATRAKTRKTLIGISYSTETITFMANLSSGERSMAIMALLLLLKER